MLIIALLLLVGGVHVTYQVSLEEFLSLTREQKAKLDQFHNLVETNGVPHDFMKEHVYLIRFLRDRKFDVGAAMKMLTETVKWRIENDIDNIWKENFTLYSQDYKAYLEGCDKEGRPVLSLFVGDWDIRRAIVAGQSKTMMRYVYSLLEAATSMLRQMQAEGHNVTQATMIWNFDHFNILAQACPSCIPIFVGIFDTIVNHYPGYVHKLYSVNASPVAIELYNLISPLFPKAFREVVENHGKNKAKWVAHLRKEIDPSNLSKTFGGVKEEGMDIHEVLMETRVKKIPFRCH